MPKRVSESSASKVVHTKKSKTSNEPPTPNESAILDVSVPADASPQEILANALSELSTSQTEPDKDKSDDSRNIAIRLFETAVERMELLYPNLAETAQKSNVALDAGVAHLFASILMELGRCVGVLGILDRALAILGHVKVDGAELAGDICLLKGKILLVQLCIEKCFNRNGLDQFTSVQMEDDDEEDEVDDEQEDEDSEENAVLTEKMRREVDLMQGVRETFIKGLEFLKDDPNQHTLKRSATAQLLRNYSLLARKADKKSPGPIALLTFALSLLEMPYSESAPTIPDQEYSDALHSTKASCLYYLARFRAQGKDGDDIGATQDIKECLRALGMVVTKDIIEKDFELKGQALLFLSSVTNDDLTALAAYQTGIKTLLSVLAKYPNNMALKLQLDSIGANEDEFDEVVDDDGNVFDLDAEIDRDDEYNSEMDEFDDDYDNVELDSSDYEEGVLGE